MRTPESAPAVAPIVRTGKRSQPTARRRILLVLEDPITIQVFHRALARRGYEVAVARDGLQALRALSKSKPDLVVLDLQLRVVSGAEVVRTVRREDALTTTPVLILAGDDPARISSLRGECSPNEWLRKPCLARELVSRVDALLAS